MAADIETRIRIWTDAATNDVVPVTVDEVRTTIRRGGRMTHGMIAAVALSLVGAGAITIAILATRGDTTSVVADRPQLSEPTTLATAPAPLDDGYDRFALVADLGPEVTRTLAENVPEPVPLLDTTPITLCVGNREVWVFEYPSAVRRAALSDRISSDGSQVPTATGIAIPEWIAPPHFYARGRIIVLYLGPQDDIADRLESLLGPTLSPDAVADTGLGAEFLDCSAR